MINRILVAMAVCVFLLLPLSGCASRPDEELKVAVDAMNQAIEQRAEQYAPSEWKSAKEIYDQAEEQLKKESYTSARTSLTTAKARFLKARDVARTEREAMQKQAEDIGQHLEENYAAFKAGVGKKAAKKDLDAASADIDKRIEIFKSLLSQGGFIEAKSAGQETLQAIEFHSKKLSGK